MRSAIPLFLLASLAFAEGEPAWLGVSVAPIDAETRSEFSIPDDVAAGAVLASVAARSPAANAGLRAGDVVVFFDGKTIENPDQLVEAVRARKAGDEVTYAVRRGTGKLEGTLKLGRRAEFEIPVPPPPPPADFEERLDRVRKRIDDLRARIDAGRPRHDFRALVEREEKALEEARGKGDAKKAEYHEIRLGLLRELRDAAPPRPPNPLADRLARIERKLDEILKRLDSPR
jgi:hypothetical protein